jgi:pilus assembly protein CpaF
LNDAQIEEIWINRPGELRFASGGRTEVVNLNFDAQQLENLVFRLLRNSSRRVDRVHPFADATLADGSRVHVVIPPITNGYWTLNVRKFPGKTRSLDDLFAGGMLTSAQHAELSDAMLAGCNVLVSGATQAGKTTFLSALLGQLPAATRVVSIEETHELRISAADWVAMQGRPEAVGDSDAIDLRRLLRESLRMRPDFLVVGEVRGAEALELLLAMNTGIPCAGTIHAKSAQSAISKLKLLPALAKANIDQRFLGETVDDVLDVVVHVERAGGKRRVSEILWHGRA